MTDVMGAGCGGTMVLGVLGYKGARSQAEGGHKGAKGVRGMSHWVKHSLPTF